MDSLKHVLKSKPSISTVYFNEKGEWQFHPRPGFDKKVDRETALKLKDLSEVVDAAPIKVSPDNPTGVGEAGTASEALVKKSDDAEDFELEKQIFAEEKAQFQAKLDAYHALLLTHDKLQKDHEKAVSELKKSTDLHKSKDAELKDLKAKVTSFEKAAKTKGKDEDFIS